jgi:hypothetical protein
LTRKRPALERLDVVPLVRRREASDQHASNLKEREKGKIKAQPAK